MDLWIAAGAAVVGSVLTLLGASLADRRAHRSWLRDQRANRYERLVSAINRMQELDMLRPATPENIASATGELADAVASVEIAGPEQVAALAASLQHACIRALSAPNGHDAIFELGERLGQAVRVALRSSR